MELHQRKQDVKRSLSTEGANIYSWFQDPKVALPLVKAVSASVPRTLTRSARVVSLGSGTGFVERGIDADLRRNFKRANVVCTDILRNAYTSSAAITLNPHLEYMVQDNNAHAFLPDSLDVVVARSVLQYEPTVEGQVHVMEQIYDSLRPGAVFVNQAPTFHSGFERDLVDGIHLLLPKNVHGLTTEETYQSMDQVFDSIDIPELQTTIPLAVDRSIFTMRYGPRKEMYPDEAEFAQAQARFAEVCGSIIHMINSTDADQRPNVWTDGEDFGFNIYYTIFRGHKKK